MIPPEQMPLPLSGAAQLGSTAKRSQSEVAYGPAYEVGQDCGHCAHFDGQGGCELVEGQIRPEMVCDLWEPA